MRVSRNGSPSPARPSRAPSSRPAPAPARQGAPSVFDVFDAFDCFVVIEDSGHTVRYINRRTRERYGDVTGKNCHRILAGRESPCPVCPVRAILHEGNGSFTCVVKDFKGRLYESSSSPLVMPDGSKAVIQLLTDITDRRKAQAVIDEYTVGLKALVAEKTAELRQSETLYHLLMEHAHDAIFTIDPTENRVLAANRMAETMTGYSEKELLAMMNTALYAPGDFDRLCLPLREAAGETGVSGEIEMMAKSGRCFPADVSASASSSRGRRVFLVICRDISQRLVIEKNMRQLASVIENMSSSVIIMDLNRRIMYVNPATLRMLGYREEEMLGRLSADFFEGVPGNPPDLSGRIAREAKNGLWEGEIVNRRKSGDLFPAFLRMCVIRNEKGAIIGYAGLSENITRRKQLEEDLIQKEKLSALGELISGIAHELNNPLTGVLGYAEIIQQHPCSPALREDLQRLYKEALRCQYLVKNLLTFSRRPPLHKVPADINAVVGLSIELKAHQLEADAIRVHTALDERIPESMLDTNQLQQVFVNIITNAHHALSEKGGDRRITISSGMRDGSIEVAIGNNGVPIPDERLEKIFIPFFSTKEFGQGTGLGLSIAQGIVKEHDGDIRVESAEERGTVFTIALPLVRPPAA